VPAPPPPPKTRLFARAIPTPMPVPNQPDVNDNLLAPYPPPNTR
ncbi:20046_t:CDS:1, partial [Racocetra persica]